MKLVAPKSFTLEGGSKAVLLLHGFTGSTKDVKRLGKYLQDRGYTVHAPMYKGHGGSPEELLETGPEDWWNDVVAGYNHLKDQGYEDIAVVGISLGAVFSLRVGEEFPVKGVVSMCAPIKRENTDGLFDRLYDYAKIYKSFEGKTREQIIAELESLKATPKGSLNDIQKITEETCEDLHEITAPTLVMQGALDAPIYQESAPFIYEQVDAEEKDIIWYKESGHIITTGKERDKVCEDVTDFLDQIDWSIAN
ncbi:alpha/beta fold hydrolase [Viridibacillus sp. FSL R5-0477]|uniref:Carboxylesterase n=1 Tax=Viridibacillus arenosi FSL R5-213 TaxID=1227360 RepID=W4ELS5_9BACL|nr:MULTISPECIES: alpha/beta fold hydrolase [Viridibacillus]ETT81204.1 carboxylesterase [Viridibacillus arenosi FSL R5-213]OMC84146.1 carboxylesterase [Viridibacillus sp. FSL H8-0123]OMC88667.1 carboxylesterase [Viridibacillus sp. FSL H7-0596]OMC93300.1 carboxylesterase [Viridibacillus arenosi]